MVLNFGEAFFAKLVKLQRKRRMWRRMFGNCPHYLNAVADGFPPTRLLWWTLKMRYRYLRDPHRLHRGAVILWIRFAVKYTRMIGTKNIMMGYTHCLKVLAHRDRTARNEFDPWE